MKNIIEVKDLEHSYGDFRAVKGISFNVREGEIFSFLGPNGAGKSTTINILITLLPIQRGKVTIAGHDIREDRDNVRNDIGIVFQDEVLDRDLTVEETLVFHARLYSIPKDRRGPLVEEMLELAELKEKRKVRVKYLSGGMRRRLEIARGLMTRPKVLFLDEPTIGLDPQTRLRIWEYIRKVNQEGTTIFLTTHYMDEADSLADRISIMDHGEIIATGTSDELKGTLGKDMVYLRSDDDERTMNILGSMDFVRDVRDTEKGLEVTIKTDGARALPILMEELRSADITVRSINMKKPTLDDVFVHYTGRELRDGPDTTKPVRMRRRR